MTRGAMGQAIAGAVASIVEVLGLDDASPAPKSGLDLSDIAARFGLAGDEEQVLDALIRLRNQARSERRFEEADSIRDELDSAGVILEDGPNGTIWLRK